MMVGGVRSNARATRAWGDAASATTTTPPAPARLQLLLSELLFVLIAGYVKLVLPPSLHPQRGMLCHIAQWPGASHVCLGCACRVAELTCRKVCVAVAAVAAGPWAAARAAATPQAPSPHLPSTQGGSPTPRARARAMSAEVRRVVLLATPPPLGGGGGGGGVPCPAERSLKGLDCIVRHAWQGLYGHRPPARRALA